MKLKIEFNIKWLQNFKIKLYTIFIALFLWFYVATNNEFDYILNLPVRVVNKPSGWVFASPIPSHVRVKFRGRGKEILGLIIKRKNIELNLNNTKKNTTFQITKEMIKDLPPGSGLVPLKIIEPEYITVRLDTSIERKVPVRADIELSVMDGYIQVGPVYLDPDSIYITGPMLQVNKINEIKTKKKVLRNLVKEIRGRVSIIKPPYQAVHYSYNTINFRADVQRIGEKVVSNIPIRVINIPGKVKNIKVIPSTLRLTLYGGVNVLKDIRAEDIEAVIDYKSKRYQEKRFKAAINLPEDIFFKNVNPQFFRVIIER